MRYRSKEVISDSEAKRFAWNLCKKSAKFPTFDEALDFVFRIRSVVSDTEFARMHREHVRQLAREVARDENTTRLPVPTVREVEAAVEVRS